VTETLIPGTQAAGTSSKVGIIDMDVHPALNAFKPEVLQYLPAKWQDYVKEAGLLRGGNPGGERPRHREFAHRWDAVTPDGREPGSNQAFAAEQLLDRYGISAAVLDDIGGFSVAGRGGQPAELSIALCRAMNEARRDQWLAADPRWYAGMTLPYELPEAAAAEIRRCKTQDGEYSDRWKVAMFAPNNMRPPGHPSYWPIYEACEEFGIPVGFHVLAGNRITPSGAPDFYFEEHCTWAQFNFPIVSSYVFEGVFERFPNLKVALLELGWSWAVPLAWRMDHAYRVMGREVPHLTKMPSEYIRDHFYYTTQPVEEPEKDEYSDEVLEAFTASGMGEKLMFSSDYPHWDFDEPFHYLDLPDEQLSRKILGGNASALLGIDLLPDTGLKRRVG
jgi:predicted TIM-barrel fold metal-dependent hydrolase